MSKNILILLLSLLGVIQAIADFVVEPNPGHAPVDGGTAPFLITSDQFPSIRYQQVYRGTAFGPVPTQTVRITELAFYAFPGASHIDFNLPSIQIRFSTTARNPDGLSQTLADNVGADQTLVYSGALHFFDTGTEAYGIRIPLQTPFIYNHGAGNLLMDVRNFETLPPFSSGVYGFAIEVATLDPVSSMSASSANALTGLGSTSGLWTRFTVTPVPEPGTSALLLAGVAACALFRWRKLRL